jgi:hypothetical protein
MNHNVKAKGMDHQESRLGSFYLLYNLVSTDTYLNVSYLQSQCQTINRFVVGRSGNTSVGFKHEPHPHPVNQRFSWRSPRVDSWMTLQGRMVAVHEGPVMPPRRLQIRHLPSLLPTWSEHSFTHSYQEHSGVLPPLVGYSRMGFASEVRQCDIR